MILETFSRVLQHPDNAGQSPVNVLMDWLYAVLMEQDYAILDSLNDNDLTASQVKTILCHAFEVITADAQTHYATNPDFGPDYKQDDKPGHKPGERRWVIVSRSANAQQLLNSLLHYAQSFDDWQYRRWLHNTKATDFKFNDPV